MAAGGQTLSRCHRLVGREASQGRREARGGRSGGRFGRSCPVHGDVPWRRMMMKMGGGEGCRQARPWVEEAGKVVGEVLGDTTELGEEEMASLLGQRWLPAVRSSRSWKRTTPGWLWMVLSGGWLGSRRSSSCRRRLGHRNRPLIGDVAVIEEWCLSGRVEQRWRRKMGSREEEKCGFTSMSRVQGIRMGRCGQRGLAETYAVGARRPTGASARGAIVN
jgi:hypothetical protein